MKKLFFSLLVLVFSAQIFASSFVFQKLEINGVSSTEKERIINNFPVRAGVQLTDKDVSSVIKFFYQQNRYRNVEAYNKGSTLVVNLLPYQIIRKFAISPDISAIPRGNLDDAFKKAGIVAGRSLNVHALEQMINEINGYYQSIGNNSRVTYSVNEVDMSNVDVKISTVDQKDDTVKISKIQFVGNQAYSEGTLKGVMESKEKGFLLFWRGKFNLPLAVEDANLIKQFYASKGYPKAQVFEPQVKYVTEKNKNLVELTYQVNEGKQYKVSGVKVLGDTVGKEKEIEKTYLDIINIGKLFNGFEVD